MRKNKLRKFKNIFNIKVQKKMVKIPLLSSCSMHKFVYYISPFCVLLAIGLILSVLLLGTKFIIPKYYEIGSTWYYLHMLFSLFLFLNIIMNYLFCVNKNPGTPASDMYKKTIQLYKPDRYEVVSSDVMDVVDDGLSWRICIKSNVLKPPRTHYCQSIHACVMNYDHYCPWAFNAIGFGNLRFFMLFLIYLSVGCFYTSYMTFRPFYDVLFKPRHEREYLEYEIPAFLFLITGLVGPAVLFLAALNLKSIFYGMTAIDELCYFHRLQIYQGYGLSKEQAAKEANPYDRGWKKNWLSMTGSYSLISSFLFPFFSEPQLPPWPSDLNSKMRILVTKNDSRHFSANNIDTSMLLGRRTAAKQQQQHFSNANPESSNREIPIKTSIFEGEKLHMV